MGLFGSLLRSLLRGFHPVDIMDGPGMEYHGEDNVPPEALGPERAGDFDGTWLTRDGVAKLVIRDGEVDLPPQPVYAKSAEDVTDRHIKSLTLRAGCSKEDAADGFLFKRLPGCEKALSLELEVTASQPAGEKLVVGKVWGDSETEEKPLREVDCPLTEALEEKLAGLLLSPEVLAHNPYCDSSDMLCPTVRFTLEAEFTSGESISIKTSYGVPVGDAAVELAALLLNGAD